MNLINPKKVQPPIAEKGGIWRLLVHLLATTLLVFLFWRSIHCFMLLNGDLIQVVLSVISFAFIGFSFKILVLDGAPENGLKHFVVSLAYILISAGLVCLVLCAESLCAPESSKRDCLPTATSTPTPTATSTPTPSPSATPVIPSLWLFPRKLPIEMGQRQGISLMTSNLDGVSHIEIELRYDPKAIRLLEPSCFDANYATIKAKNGESVCSSCDGKLSIGDGVIAFVIEKWDTSLPNWITLLSFDFEAISPGEHEISCTSCIFDDLAGNRIAVALRPSAKFVVRITETITPTPTLTTPAGVTRTPPPSETIGATSAATAKPTSTETPQPRIQYNAPVLWTPNEGNAVGLTAEFHFFSPYYLPNSDGYYFAVNLCPASRQDGVQADCTTYILHNDKLDHPQNPKGGGQYKGYWDYSFKITTPGEPRSQFAWTVFIVKMNPGRSASAWETACPLSEYIVVSAVPPPRSACVLCNKEGGLDCHGRTPCP